jgi:hypothetical protein
LIGRKPIVKKLMILTVLGLLFGSVAGCHIGECWRESRAERNPQQAVIVSEPCVVTDSCCNSCGTSCSSCAAPALTPSPASR